MIINDELLMPLISESRSNQRRRKNYNFHKVADDPLQRMLNVIQTDSYVQPHKHANPDKREAFILIKGRLLVVIFSDAGDVLESVVLDTSKGNYGYDVKPAIYHSIIALENDTIVYEVKDGPYNPLDDKNFAPWAPSENNPEEAMKYINDLKRKVLKTSKL